MNFATYLHHQKISSTYRITQDPISDAINALRIGSFIWMRLGFAHAVVGRIGP